MVFLSVLQVDIPGFCCLCYLFLHMLALLEWQLEFMVAFLPFMRVVQERYFVGRGLYEKTSDYARYFIGCLHFIHFQSVV